MVKLELKKVIKFNFLSKNISLSWSDQTRQEEWFRARQVGHGGGGGGGGAGWFISHS